MLLQSCLSEVGSETSNIQGESKDELKRENCCGMLSLCYDSLTLKGGERGVGEKLEGGDVEQKNKCR